MTDPERATEILNMGHADLEENIIAALAEVRAEERERIEGIAESCLFPGRLREYLVARIRETP